MAEKLAVWLAVVAAILIACGDDPAGSLEEANGGAPSAESASASPVADGAGARSNLPCDVDRILRERCQTCHGQSPIAGAAISLVTHDDLQKESRGKRVALRVKERIHDQERIMPPKPGALTSAELATLDDWIDKGAPSSAENCELPNAPDAVKPLSCKHYNSGAGKFGGEVEASGYELCTTENLRPHDAGVAGFGTIEFAIPPRSKFTLTCNFPATPEWIGKKFFTAFPHMHKQGAALSSERVPLGGGAPQVIASQEGFDFNNQMQIPANATIQAGDIIRTKCSWKNTSDRIITFGETTDSEMCFNFLSYYPAIPAYPWVAPSLLPCVPELGKLD